MKRLVVGQLDRLLARMQGVGVHDKCVFDCNCPRGLLDAGDVCITENSWLGIGVCV